jgi:hypothetical protein
VSKLRINEGGLDERATNKEDLMKHAIRPSPHKCMQQAGLITSHSVEFYACDGSGRREFIFRVDACVVADGVVCVSILYALSERAIGCASCQ